MPLSSRQKLFAEKLAAFTKAANELNGAFMEVDCDDVETNAANLAGYPFPTTEASFDAITSGIIKWNRNVQEFTKEVAD